MSKFSVAKGHGLFQNNCCLEITMSMDIVSLRILCKLADSCKLVRAVPSVCSRLFLFGHVTFQIRHQGNIIRFYMTCSRCMLTFLTVTNAWKLQVEISSVKKHLVSAGVETRLL